MTFKAEFEAEKLFHVKVVLEQKCKNRSHNPTKKWSSINDTILIKSFKEKYLGHSIYQRQFYCIFFRKSNKCRDIDIHKMAIDSALFGTVYIYIED